MKVKSVLIALCLKDRGRPGIRTIHTTKESGTMANFIEKGSSSGLMAPPMRENTFIAKSTEVALLSMQAKRFTRGPGNTENSQDLELSLIRREKS